MSCTENKDFIIFDFDGTLTDEADWYLSKWQKTSVYAAKKYGFTNFFEKIKETIKKRGFFFKATVNEALMCYGHQNSRKIIFDIVNYYKMADVDIKVLNGIKPLLSRLKSSKKKLGIISNGRLRIQIEKIKKSGLGCYFDKIIIADRYPKPDTLSYIRMAEFFRAHFHSMVYIGDNPLIDFKGAKKLKIHTVRIKQGIFKDILVDPLDEADIVVDNLRDYFRKEVSSSV